MFLTQESLVFVMGSNSNGKLGLGVENLRCSETPQLLSSLTNEKVVELALGNEHSVALTAKGEVYTWGRGAEGALGLKNIHNQSKPALLDHLQT